VQAIEVVVVNLKTWFQQFMVTENHRCACYGELPRCIQWSCERCTRCSPGFKLEEKEEGERVRQECIQADEYNWWDIMYLASKYDGEPEKVFYAMEAGCVLAFLIFGPVFLFCCFKEVKKKLLDWRFKKQKMSAGRRDALLRRQLIQFDKYVDTRQLIECQNWDVNGKKFDVPAELQKLGMRHR